MNTILCFLFLAFALVLSHQDVQKRKDVQKRGGGPSRQRETPESRAATAALDNFKNPGAPIELDALQVTDPCRSILMASRLDVGNTGVHYNFQQTCYVFGEPDLKMSVKSKTEAPIAPTASNPEFQAVFLYYEDNKNTYMILDPGVNPGVRNRVRWFFTSRLSGCDVFVARPKATAPPNIRHNAIVIHSNLNECVNNARNLQLKGTSVDETISHHPNYELIARAYCKPKPNEQVQANQFLRQYEISHPNVRLVSYDVEPPAVPQLFYFFGEYKPGNNNAAGKWEFTLKGADDGLLTPVVSVPPV